MWFRNLKSTKDVKTAVGVIRVNMYCLKILCVLKNCPYCLKNGSTLPFLARLKMLNLYIIKAVPWDSSKSESCCNSSNHFCSVWLMRFIYDWCIWVERFQLTQSVVDSPYHLKPVPKSTSIFFLIIEVSLTHIISSQLIQVLTCNSNVS